MKSHSWWPQQLLIGWLNLIITAPVIYLFVGLPLILRQHQWSGTEIGLLQLAGLPAMLKFILATPVDRWHLGREKNASYRHWMIVLVSGFALVLSLLSVNDLESSSFSRLFILAMLASLLGTWADVPLNALAIQILPPSERIRAGVIRSMATSLAAIVGGGLMLVLNAHFGWSAPFIGLAIALLLSLLLLPGMRKPSDPDMGASSPLAVSRQPTTASSVGFRDWIDYFRTAEYRYWGLLLIVYFPAIGAAWVYLKPLLLDQGLQASQIAWTIGVMGGLVAALAGALADTIIRKLGSAQALCSFALGNLLAITFLLLSVMYELGNPVLITAAMLIAIAMGASAGLLFGLMMNHARHNRRALDYGIQSSLFVTARTLVLILSGILLDSYGYHGMLSGLILLAIIAFAIAWYSRNKLFYANTGGNFNEHHKLTNS